MAKAKERGLKKHRQGKDVEGTGERPVRPVELPSRVVAKLPFLYRALTEVLVQDGLVQLTFEDTPTDETP